MFSLSLPFALLALSALQPSPNPVVAPMADAKIELELKLDASKATLAVSISSRDGQDFSFSPAWLSAANITLQTPGGPVTLEGANDGPAVTLPAGAQIYREISLDKHREAIEKGAEIQWKSGSIEIGPLRFARVLPTVAGPGGTEAEVRAYFGKMTNEELAQHTVTIRTNKGDMKAEFYPDKAPNHVKNFLTLSLSGYYKDKVFHRIYKGFMIQGGCPLGTGSGSHGPRINLEPSDLKHVRGVLSMARTPDKNSATCQFFVMHGANAGLDREYSAFGKLIEGLDTLDKICDTKVRANAQGEMSVPTEEIKMLDVIVEKKDQSAATKASN